MSNPVFWEKRKIFQYIDQLKILPRVLLALVAQLDAFPTCDLEVAGLTPAGLATFFSGDLIMKYFLWSFSPFHHSLPWDDSKKMVVSFWQKNVHNTD